MRMIKVRVALGGILLLVATVALAAGHKKAILVGVDTYQALPQGTQYEDIFQKSVRHDVEDMTFLLQCCGYESHDIKPVLGGAASRVGIKSAMALELSEAHSGDEIVFYFSGRGSVAKPDAHTRMGAGLKGNEPTLAPFDAQLGSSDFDLRMSLVEDWAKQLKGKGCAVDVVLDCSFALWQGRSEQRHYLDVPRTLPLKTGMRTYASDGVRDPIFAYDGAAFLSASAPAGKAYVWRKSFGENNWEGAFTDFFVGLVVDQLRTDELNHSRGGISMAKALIACRSYFQPLAKIGYMPGMGPSSNRQASDAENEHELFCKFEPPKPSSSLTAEISKRAAAKKLEESRVRVALEVEDNSPQQETRTKLANDFDAAAKLYTEDVAVVSHWGASPERVLKVTSASGGLSAMVGGTTHEQYAGVTGSGATVSDLLKGDIGNYLEVQGLSKRVWDLLGASSRSSLGYDANCLPEYNPMERGTEFTAMKRPEAQILDPKLTLPNDARVYVFYQYDTDHRIVLLFPDRKAGESQDPGKVIATGDIMLNFLSTGASSMGYTFLITNDDQVPRNVELRTLFLPDQPGVDLWSLADSQLSVYARLARHLRGLIQALKKPHTQWQSVIKTYKVVDKPTAR